MNKFEVGQTVEHRWVRFDTGTVVEILPGSTYVVEYGKDFENTGKFSEDELCAVETVVNEIENGFEMVFPELQYVSDSSISVYTPFEYDGISDIVAIRISTQGGYREYTLNEKDVITLANEILKRYPKPS